MKRAKFHLPELGKTKSVIEIRNLVTVMELRVWQQMDVKVRLDTLTSAFKAMVRTLEQLGMYNHHIYAKYLNTREGRKAMRKGLLRKTQNK